MQQPPSNSVNLNDLPETSQDRSQNYPFFQQNQNNTNPSCQSRNQPAYDTANYFLSDDKVYYNQNFQLFYPSQRSRSYSIDQPDFLNQKLEVNRHDILEQIEHPEITFFKCKIESKHNLINQLKCVTKNHYRIIYNKMK